MSQPTTQPFSAVIMGPPGVGKSTMAGSICEVVDPEEVLLIVTKLGEEQSWLYRKYGLEPELYYDRNWKPTLDMLEAGAFIKLLRRLHELLDDEEYGAVIIDPGTDAINLLEHYILEPQGVGSPGDLHDTQGFYRQLKDKAQEFVSAAAALSTSAAKRPKFVLMPWHVQPPKEGIYVKMGGGKDKQQSADEKGAGIEYEGAVLPMLEGSYRRKLAGDVSMVIYCDVDTTKEFDKDAKKMVEHTEYFVQAASDKDRHAKIRIAKALSNQRFPNSMKALIEAMEAD